MINLYFKKWWFGNHHHKKTGAPRICLCLCIVCIHFPSMCSKWLAWLTIRVCHVNDVDNRGQAAPTLSYGNPVCQAVGQPKCLLYVLMLASLDGIDWWKSHLRRINPDTEVLTDKHFEIHLHVEWLMWYDVMYCKRIQQKCPFDRPRYVLPAWLKML